MVDWWGKFILYFVLQVSLLMFVYPSWENFCCCCSWKNDFWDCLVSSIVVLSPPVLTRTSHFISSLPNLGADPHSKPVTAIVLLSIHVAHTTCTSGTSDLSPCRAGCRSKFFRYWYLHFDTSLWTILFSPLPVLYNQLQPNENDIAHYSKNVLYFSFGIFPLKEVF